MSKKIVITGASSAIGLAIANDLFNENDSFFFHGNNHVEKLNTLYTNAENVNIIQADFQDKTQLADFCAKIENTDVVINAAGLVASDLLGNYSDEMIQKLIDVNIFSLIKICQKVIPDMLVKRKGCIINLSSVAAQRGNRGQSVYAGTKGFVESFSKSVAAEYGKKGIRINVVAPGPINSGSLIELASYAEDYIKNSTVLNKAGKPENVAKLVKFLASDDAEFITGKIFNVDGGFQTGV